MLQDKVWKMCSAKARNTLDAPKANTRYTKPRCLGSRGLSPLVCSGFPRSWKILEFETILESHGNVHKPLVPCMIYGYDSLLVYIYMFTTYFPDLSCMHYNVSIVMVVAVRGGYHCSSKMF